MPWSPKRKQTDGQKERLPGRFHAGSEREGGCNQTAAGGTFPTDRQPVSLPPTCLSKPPAFLEIQRSFAQKEADTGTNHCCSDGLKQSGNHPKTASCQPVKRKEEDVNAILAIALHCIVVHKCKNVCSGCKLEIGFNIQTILAGSG